jgi:hypothetical protein
MVLVFEVPEGSIWDLNVATDEVVRETGMELKKLSLVDDVVFAMLEELVRQQGVVRAASIGRREEVVVSTWARWFVNLLVIIVFIRGEGVLVGQLDLNCFRCTSHFDEVEDTGNYASSVAQVAGLNIPQLKVTYVPDLGWKVDLRDRLVSSDGVANYWPVPIDFNYADFRRPAKVGELWGSFVGLDYVGDGNRFLMVINWVDVVPRLIVLGASHSALARPAPWIRILQQLPPLVLGIFVTKLDNVLVFGDESVGWSSAGQVWGNLLVLFAFGSPLVHEFLGALVSFADRGS